MKKALFFAAVAAAMTACTSDVDLGMQQANQENADNAIGFQVLNKNMSRASLDEEGHYNFGVWAYKENDNAHEIMGNYLVGFFGPNKGYQQFTETTPEGMTSSDKGVSKWGYEGLGTAQYGLAGHSFDPGYYTPTNNDYMSNHEYQYLRYWDYSSTHTNFYAYAPYIKNANPVTYSNGDHTMTFPMGSIKDGVNDVTKYEYMYAAAKVEKTNYNKAVQLQFKRLNAKVNIAFYEDIAGYEVILEKLVDGTVDISAAPAKQSGLTHAYSNGLRKTAGAKVKFTEPDYTSATVTNDYTGSAVYAEGEYLKFDLPEISGAIATSRADALTLNAKKATSYSTTTYYAIPKEDVNECGLTFHVSFTLKSTTNETIKVQDARVFVPAANCKWEANKKYTYVFKITKDVTGTTGDPTPLDPGAPEIGAKALYPIVFDGITVDDWTDGSSESGNDHKLN